MGIPTKSCRPACHNEHPMNIPGNRFVERKLLKDPSVKDHFLMFTGYLYPWTSHRYMHMMSSALQEIHTECLGDILSLIGTVSTYWKDPRHWDKKRAPVGWGVNICFHQKARPLGGGIKNIPWLSDLLSYPHLLAEVGFLHRLHWLDKHPE